MSKISSIGIIKSLFVFLLFLTPLIFTTATEELFEFPKMYFVYILGSTIIYIFLLSGILKPKKIITPKLLITIFILLNFISVLTSSHVYTSIWGYYSRFNDGLISLLIMFGLLMVFINVFKKGQGERVFIAPVLSLLPISVFAITQHFTMSPNARIFSTLGQANWLAAYIVMVVPLVLHYITKHETKNGVRYLFAVLLILAYMGMWFTYSLSGILGLLVGTIMFIYLNKSQVFEHKKLLTGTLAVCIILSVLMPGIYAQRVKDVLFDINKVNAQSNEQPAQISDPGFIRAGIWRGTLDMATSSVKVFVVGIGPETFPYEFQNFRPKDLNYSSEWNFILNKPHNYYLELLVETGILGFLSYFTLIYYSIKAKHKFATPMLLSLYVTNFFGFPTVATSLLFFIMLGKIQTDSFIQDTS